MAVPKTAITRFDLSMSYAEFSNRMNQLQFMGLGILTPIFVGMQSAEFRRVKVESVLNKVEDTKRAPGGSYKRKDFEWEVDSYATHEYGVEEPLDDRTLAMYGREINAEIIYADRATNRVLMDYEDAVAAAVFDTSVWTGASLTTALATPWSNKAGADPIKDVDAAIEKVEDSCGARPNTLVLPSLVARDAIRTDRIEDLLKYSGLDDPKKLNANTLAEIFNIERVVVPGGFKNTADDGQSPAFGRLWDQTKAMVLHVNSDQDLENPLPCVGRTIMWSEESGGAAGNVPGLIIEEYREENVRGSVVRARTDYQIKILHKEAGHLLTAVRA